MTKNICKFVAILLGLWLTVPASPLSAANLVERIKIIKPSIVGIGSHNPLGRPINRLVGTGFVVGDGRHVVTNMHVADGIDDQEGQSLAIFIGTGRIANVRRAHIVSSDVEHDVAILSFEGGALPALSIADDQSVDEGLDIAFTGFPIGAVYGLHPVTHRGMISAITPIAIPQVSPRSLDPSTIRRLQKGFDVFQLDATAYPGNSGSPVFNPETGEVVAIVSSVFVKESKIATIEKPSGITFAIPIRYALELLIKENITAAP